MNLPVHITPVGGRLKDATGNTLADMRYSVMDEKARQFIVRAVNCHAELLELAKFVAEHPRAASGRGDIEHSEWSMMQLMAKAAIAKAEGA